MEQLKPHSLTIGIGFDQREAVAYHTLCHSILSRSSIPISFIPIKRTILHKVHTRPLDPQQSNEFSFTRFLLPYLCGFEGVSLFMDCDMLVRCDIAEILDYHSWQAAVHVVKHDYTPIAKTKYLGNVQYPYPRKNWSSVMLFNNYMCRKLTPEYVNEATGKMLHRFEWTTEEKIYSLPVEWNHLVQEYQPNPGAKIVHWTNFGPWLDGHDKEEFADEWFEERARMRYAMQEKEIPSRLVVSER